jgi:hypothetical protein
MFMTGSTGAFNLKGAIYSDTSGLPDKLLVRGNAVVVVAAADDAKQILMPLETTLSMTANTYYWLAILNDATATLQHALSSSVNAKYLTRTYASGMPAVFGTPTGNEVTFTNMLF